MSIKSISLAMDLSLTQPGFAVLGITDAANDGTHSPIILEKSCVKTNAKHSHGRRLCEIEDEIARLINTYRPEHIVREKGFSRFPSVTQTLFKVVGISDRISYVLADKEIHEIAVTSVKKAVTGNGKSTKEQVAESVFDRLQISNTDDFYTKKGKLIDDYTDAAAVGIAYYIEKGLIDN